MAKHMEGWGPTRPGARVILGHCRPAELAGRDGAEQGAWGVEAKLAAVGTTTWPNKLGIQINVVPESESEALGLPGGNKSKYSLPKIPNIKKETEQREIKRQQKENTEIKEHEQWLEEIRNGRIQFKKPSGIRILDSKLKVYILWTKRDSKYQQRTRDEGLCRLKNK